MKKYYWLISILTIFLVNCKEVPSDIVDSYIYLQKNGRDRMDWRIIWEDHFDNAKLDTTKWTRIPPNNADWGKHMTSNQQCYSISNGNLFLKGIINQDTLNDPRPFLTGGIYSKGKFAFQYGKIEIRAKLESAQGAWPAIWMLAEQKKYGAYPRNGEIDIMEHLNFDDIIYQTTHSYYTLELKQKETPPHHGTTKVDTSRFNTYGLEWYPDKLVFTLNDEETFIYPRVKGVDSSQWPYDQPFYVLIDQQLGGAWVGKVNPDNLPVQMIIDFVKVYQ
ncbi:glycoside hydrolase family 16 protein [Flavivirga spongiicola]|uniref:Glycoside hydrolase family 16 protein n=1 Tax=Flavivirga spongiicola TaxID=421621 RepID=A0ABU7XQY6_9FLAO|nr:glycoside hydrolase family 16 protein [Flavivirga sp. MEBiC05379]MDO5977981.1 glycoside hydrolase family 16 protein [Flavivirga sp. MEBiC05379]